ncbi:MAG: 4-(cytidine 5'-diphospho)-2-C-methyl-D-erythritol kinase [Candidatus Omnitrophica bacterium]|nr:4-(cytidine 5'-diphospho)-2-C-methyl-D-erythritol kinase [Candidatus Omnitrophota bacterium]
MTSIELDAHAKVNLFLKVLNKRKDAYHNIHTIFERISLADRIKISKIPKGIEVFSDRFITRDPKKNLVYKAAEALIKNKKLKSGVRINIKKRIPIGAGLGGGSSDAAAVLMGMNRLFDLRIRRERLMMMGAAIGSDVPFFIFDRPLAIGRSRGERLKAVNSGKRTWHLIIYPGVEISASSVYKAFDFALTKAKTDVKIQLPFKLPLDFGEIEAMLHNDLESVVASKKGSTSAIIRRLASLLGKKTIVSGSGPSVFCLYRTREEVSRARRRLFSFVPASRRKDWQVFIARTC